MLPLIPPSTINDLANDRFQASPDRRRSNLANPDHFFGDDALPPDPLFMGLRAVVTTGPIGRVWARFERWREAREDRQIAAEQASVAVDDTINLPGHASLTPADRELAERDLAA